LPEARGEEGGAVWRTKLALSLLLVIAPAVATAAVGLEAGIDLAYTTMANVNSLVIEAPEGGSVSPDLHLGIGGHIAAVFDLSGPIPVVFAQLHALSVSSTELDADAAASLIGLACGLGMHFGKIDASVAASFHHGGFDFPAARQMGLSGWGFGLMAGAVDSASVTPRLEASFRLQGQWLPVSEMLDESGHTYRGRGMPYLDFSGVSASISLGWKP
jgi:hypothetical protein